MSSSPTDSSEEAADATGAGDESVAGKLTSRVHDAVHTVSERIDEFHHDEDGTGDEFDPEPD